MKVWNKLKYCGFLLLPIFASLPGFYLGGCEPGEPKTRIMYARGKHAPEPGSPEIRVLLSKTHQLAITTFGAAGFIHNPATDASLLELPRNHFCTISRQGDKWHIQQEHLRNSNLTVPVRPEGLEIRPQGGAVLYLKTESLRGYRGKIKLIPTDSENFAVVNCIALEQYLAGVVGAEMPARWPTQALQAQTIASRTYALYQMHHCPKLSHWDIGSDQFSQMYLGTKKEDPRVNQAVQATRGLVLACGAAGREKIFPSYYCSICGGHTQNAAVVFGDTLEPLRGRPCPYCRTTAPKNRFRWDTVTISQEELSQLLLQSFPQLRPLEKVVNITITQRSKHGRVEIIRATGLNGQTADLRAEEFRLAINSVKPSLLSSWYQLIDAGNSWKFSYGHGWGHGVGMCQYGCQGLAANGKKYQEILQYYYPESVLLRAY